MLIMQQSFQGSEFLKPGPGDLGVRDCLIHAAAGEVGRGCVPSTKEHASLATKVLIVSITLRAPTMATRIRAVCHNLQEMCLHHLPI
ncbi:hypothetical protein OPV22_009842 [Ensete ventricosum]|uniref:Uncharacterized protein n=1 Tax=Ensete ventricosum TaxID=4639 RepID=A0AAV8RC02_ENSVE|nr:hypothetical protein OPV22_009842 [Ensete ventricosum]